MPRMFIRKTRIGNKITGEAYFTHRLVRGERIAGKTRQIVVLNLGRHFSIQQEEWPLLCARLEQLLSHQGAFLPIDCPPAIESAAQRIVKKLIDRATLTSTATATGEKAVSTTPEPRPDPDVQAVNVDSLELTDPRSVGVEHLALQAVSQLGLIEKLTDLGINGVMRSAILGNIIGRMAQPASELATLDWLKHHSALGELIDVDFEGLSHMRLYRASDLLMRHRDSIEAHVLNTAKTLFHIEETVTLYDLTNTYFEGEATANPKAKRGRSKEKRSDCPLVTLGLVLDGSGFVRRSKTFTGNVSEGKTLQEMLTGLGASLGAMVILDAGISTEENLAWLAKNGYRYLVVRRGGARQFDVASALTIKTAGGATVQLQKKLSEDGKEVQLYCHSEGRAAKETAMFSNFCKKFEDGLQKIAEGLKNPTYEKSYEKLLERVGRLKEKSKGVSQHYAIDWVLDEAAEVDDKEKNKGKTKTKNKTKIKKVIALKWEQKLVPGTMATHPGVYCLRSNVLDWDAEKLWQTYTMLTDLESVFRSLKSELGLRPVFHSTENRVDGHLFITVLAYQCVQVLRTQLKAAGIHDSWATIRQTLSRQRRVTVVLRRADGRTIHVRKSTRAEPELTRIYQALSLNPAPGGIKKLLV